MQQQALKDFSRAKTARFASGFGEPTWRNLIPGRIAWLHHTVFVTIGREMTAGRNTDEVSRQALVLLDDIEDLLSEKVLNYAVRGER